MGKKTSKTCSVSDCKAAVHAKGLCQQHYDAVRKRRTRTSDASGRIDRGPGGYRVCKVPGCSGPYHAKGYCKDHYNRLRRVGPGELEPQTCEVAGCRNPVLRNRRCKKHLRLQATEVFRRLTKAERLQEIKRRHDLMRREIEKIKRSLEAEREEEG